MADPKLLKEALSGYGYLQKNISGDYDVVSCTTGKTLKTIPHEEAFEFILESGCFLHLENNGIEE